MERRSFLDSLGTALGLSLAGLLGTRRTGLSLDRAEENDPVLEYAFHRSARSHHLGT